MCGLACILRYDGEPIPRLWIERLDSALSHRGPDDAGEVRETLSNPHGDSHIALVHRRLSILDHEGGRQPMSTEDGIVTVIFNGCIYNHRDLRRELESRGARFVSDHSDTEVLLHGWREWGEALPERLEGMFAFIVLDRDRRVLFAARDRAGEKPLYLHERPGMLALVSERSALRVATGGLDLSGADPVAIASYLRWGYVDDQRWLDGSMALRPGERLTVDLNEAEPRMTADYYWRMPEVRERRARASEAEDRVEALLKESVAQRLEADVPLGCFLSGGIDSSLIAAMARKSKPDLRTFCVRMNDPRYDESQRAERIADHLGLSHTTLDVAPSPAEDLPLLIERLGEPFGDSSLLPTHWVSKAAREHLAVALTGDGGDELFLGYERHAAGQLLARAGRLLRRLPTRLLRSGHPKSRWTKLARLASAARAGDRERQYRSIVCLFDDSLLNRLGLSAPPSGFAETIAASGGEGFVAADFARNLPWDLLRKIDAASMACALEVRAPFLDSALVEYALSLPLRLLMPRLKRKGLLLRVAARHVPRELLAGPKMGFAIPLGEWFRNDFGSMRTLLHDALLSHDAFRGLPIDLVGVQELIEEHERGESNHEHRLFALLTLALWARGRIG